nr:exodeoxyribonuclease V subunit gamma [uncultured Friedmanniella sp.]
MSLQIHRAERADRLVDALADLLAEPLGDPFATEVVAIPTPGVERWLAQRLSRRLGTSPGGDDGICAGVDFPSARHLVQRALGSAEDAAGDPWRPRRAVWPLLRVIDESRGEPWAALLWSHLGEGTDQVRAGRRWTTARHLADLFDRYAGHRPNMLLSWAQGRDVDDDGRALPGDRAWQAELWRRLRAELGGNDPASRLRAATARLREDPTATDLPGRVSLLGPTRIDPQHAVVLAALARHRDVHLWLPHPSPALWERLRPAVHGGLHSRGAETADTAGGHRLLAYLGRDVRELQQVVAAVGGAATDLHHPATAAGPATLLAQLQSDIAADQPPRSERERPRLDPADRSVQLHRSHGPDRQVEVLRDVLVGMLADDPTLEPRDIVVLCPDIETYAPLVAATFGLDSDLHSAEHPGHRLRVRLADRSLRQVNPLLGVLSRVLLLTTSRMEAASVLDLAATPAVARRFGLSADDLDRLRVLVAQSGVRWGLDGPHRAAFAMDGFAQNTWAAGLDRLLLGVAMDESGHHHLGTALPLDDVDSADVDLVGRLAELVDRLRELTDRASRPQPLSAWTLLFREVLELLTAVPRADGWQVAHAHGELSRLLDAAAEDAELELSAAEVTALLAETFRGRPGRSNFRTGTLTMCTMHPMRSVPHRVVCLLGIDDGVFPRRARPDGDDLTGIAPRVGDADVRSEDRQLMLDALMAAEDTLVVVHGAMDPRTGADVPAAVPVKELQDALDRTARTDDGRSVSAAVTLHHRLQPFDPANFVPGALRRPRQQTVESTPPPVADPASAAPFSFDAAGLRAARTALQVRRPPPPVFATAGLPPLPDEPVALAELGRFFKHPVRDLLRRRAGVSLRADEEALESQIPVDLDGLGRWQIGDRLLQQHLQGVGLPQLQAAEWRRGQLPPRSFGSQLLGQVSEQVAAVGAAAAPFRTAPARRYEIDVAVGATTLVGTVGGVHGDDLVVAGYSQLDGRAKLQSWLSLLALTVAHPGRPWRAVTVGARGISRLGPVKPAFAGTVLADLLQLYRAGLCAPIPFAARTAASYARIRYSGAEIAPSLQLLRNDWSRDCDEVHLRVLGPQVGGGRGFDALLREPSLQEEERGSLAEPSRFGTLARRVFHPLLLAEQAP